MSPNFIMTVIFLMNLLSAAAGVFFSRYYTALNFLCDIGSVLFIGYSCHWFFEREKFLNNQQKKIDELEKKLASYESTGMIGASPAQFMERIRELQLKNDTQAKMLKGQQATLKELAQVNKENELRRKYLESIGEHKFKYGLKGLFSEQARECEAKIREGL